MFANQPPQDQIRHWDATFSRNPAFFGPEPSGFARDALQRFRTAGVRTLLELGPGQGRDTFFFARNGLRVTALDYSAQAVEDLSARAAALGLSQEVAARVHDVRQPLPMAAESVDACHAHMLLCMELSMKELQAVMDEVHRVLRPGGLAVWSVRSSFDPQSAAGRELSQGLREVGGFVIRFFSEEMVRDVSKAFDIVHLDRIQEGSLPRDLFAVCLRKPGSAAAGAA